jgi:ADP-heptose:LPS heptosyltransferase
MKDAVRETEATAELQLVQHAAILDRLNRANQRIAELEKHLKKVQLENNRAAEALARKFQGHHAEVDDHNVFHAYEMARILEACNLTERRRIWQTSLQRLGVSGAMAALYPHDGGLDPLTILVRGSGGYGDMLYLSMVVRGLYYHFERPRIFVVHEHPGVTAIFADNPYIVEAICLQGDSSYQFVRVAGSLDVFDLIADVRYAVTYAAPPRSRVSAQFLLEANSRAWMWQKYVRRDWPFLNNLFAREVVDRGYNQYSFVEHTANTTIPLGHFGDFYVSTNQLPVELASSLRRPYVTIHHGADRSMAANDGLQTKNLPAAKWQEIVDRLVGAGFATVQLGEAHEQLIQGVDVDLRGRTSLTETAHVLRYAQVHVDTEGGLVHLARAVGTASVVAFGPTSVEFFGYAEHVNVAASECGNCWWTAKDWSSRCPLDASSVACMESHSAERICQSALQLAGGHLCLDLVRLETLQSPALLDRLITLAGEGKGGRGGVAVETPSLLAAVGKHVPADCMVMAIGDAFRQVVDDAPTVYPATISRLPVESGHLNWVICQVTSKGAAIDSTAGASLLFECARVVGNGLITLAVTNSAGPSVGKRISRGILEALHELPGGRLKIGDATSSELAEDGSGGVTLLTLRVTSSKPASSPAPLLDALSTTPPPASLGSGIRVILNHLK